MKAKISDNFMTALAVIAVLILLALITMPAWAGSPHHDHPAPAPIIIYVNDTAGTSSTTYTDTATVTDLVNTTNIENYTVNECQGVAIAMAGANNQMNMGTEHPQLSLGVGECNSDLASSLMFGMRLNKNLMLNGSWATDKEVNAFGIGLGVVFK